MAAVVALIISTLNLLMRDVEEKGPITEGDKYKRQAIVQIGRKKRKMTPRRDRAKASFSGRIAHTEETTRNYIKAVVYKATEYLQACAYSNQSERQYYVRRSKCIHTPYKPRIMS